jgi:hypothetical protein
MFPWRLPRAARARTSLLASINQWRRPTRPGIRARGTMRTPPPTEELGAEADQCASNQHFETPQVERVLPEDPEPVAKAGSLRLDDVRADLVAFVEQ